MKGMAAKPSSSMVSNNDSERKAALSLKKATQARTMEKAEHVGYECEEEDDD